jgi:rubrerythrin
MTMSASALILAYVVSLLAALSALAIYSEFRRRRFGPTPSEDNIFRCRSCGYLYTDDPDVDRSRCAQCGKLNDAIEF